MRVCLVTGSFPLMDCGVGDYSWQLARHLAASVAVTVVTSDRPAVKAFLDSQGGPSRAGQATPDVRAVVRDWGVRSLPALRRAVLAAGPDVVHIQYATAAFDLGAGVNLLAHSLNSVAPGLPVLTTLHDPGGPRLFRKAGPLRALLVRLLCRRSDAVCCPDRLVRAWVRSYAAGTPAFQVPVGVNVPPVGDGDGARARARRAARSGIRARHPEAFAGSPLLVTFGNLHPDRDYESVFAALRSLAEGSASRPSARRWNRIQWVLVGGAGRGSGSRRPQELREIAGRLGLASRVHFVGYCPPEAVTAWMEAADLCVLPLPQGATDARGSLLVALAHGRATVVVGPGVFSEHLRDGEHLRCVPPGRPDGLARLLDELLRDRGCRERLGRAGRAAVDRHYRWSRIAGDTIAIYRQLTKADPGVLPCCGVEAPGAAGIAADPDRKGGAR